MFTVKSEVVGQPSVVSDDLVQSVDQKICERQHFTISEVRLGHYKFCARWVSKMLMGAHKTQ
jgi:hypothetical protein